MIYIRAGALLLLCGWTLPVHAQKGGSSEALVIYKDGFSLRGNVHEKVADVIFDKASGRPFGILSGSFFIDDGVRSILFSPGQVQNVTKIDPVPSTGVTRFDRYTQSNAIDVRWQFEGFSSWDDKGDRKARYRTLNGGLLELDQRIASLTSQRVLVVTSKYAWNQMYFTQEFAPEWTRDIFFRTLNERKIYKEMKDPQKLLLLAKFLQEAGWFTEAEYELERCIANFPGDSKAALEQQTELKRIRASLFVESVEQAAKAGQPQEAIDRLETYEKRDLQKLVSERHRQMVQDQKAIYEKAKSNMQEARAHLRNLLAFSKNRSSWTPICNAIDAELNYDTVERLERFLPFAEQFEKERKEKTSSTQAADEVLAMAVTGWLQGKTAAEPDPKTALKLAAARQFILSYLKTKDEDRRIDSMSAFKRENDLQTDVIGRLVSMLPPVDPYDLTKLSKEAIKIELPEAIGGAYLVQLPPGYHPFRTYPVMIALHSGRDKPEEMVKRLAPEAAKQGFILVAPLWGSGNGVLKTAKYQYSETEHTLVLETLKDLRRRFQVDSDRVSLFGWEEGANFAFDVGLAHPDVFCGIISKNGMPAPLARRFFWPNAQYLPLYVIEGEKNSIRAKAIVDLFKRWTKEPYMATYVEYKGRGSEWYSSEIPHIFNWAGRKKRHHPMKEVGRINPSGGAGEEFRTSRTLENRFYWLSSDAIADRCQQDVRNITWSASYQPASFQASLSVGNKEDSKGKAVTWNQIEARLSGVKTATFWLESSLTDFSRDFLIRVNGQNAGTKSRIDPNLGTMLEELYRTGDRQRLIVAKITVKL